MTSLNHSKASMGKTNGKYFAEVIIILNEGGSRRITRSNAGTSCAWIIPVDAEVESEAVFFFFAQSTPFPALNCEL